MKLLKTLASLLATTLCGLAFAAPACNHDADPTDPSLFQRDLKAGNLVSQRLVPAGEEITMGYGKKGEKVTCVMATQRLFVTDKAGKEYDANCGNVIFAHNKKGIAPAAPLTKNDDCPDCAETTVQKVLHIVEEVGYCKDRNGRKWKIGSDECKWPDVKTRAPDTKVEAPSQCVLLMAKMLERKGGMVRVRTKSNAQGSAWQPVENFNKYLEACGCKPI